MLSLSGPYGFFFSAPPFSGNSQMHFKTQKDLLMVMGMLESRGELRGSSSQRSLKCTPLPFQCTCTYYPRRLDEWVLLFCLSQYFSSKIRVIIYDLYTIRNSKYFLLMETFVVTKY